MTYITAALNFLKAHWVTVLALAMALWAVDKPYVTAYIAHHPLASALYANIAAVVAFYLPSPVAK